MERLTRRFLTGTAALFLALGIGAAGQSSASARNRYGIDVFPSWRTHYQFAYQLRRNGHHGRIYYASARTRLGRNILKNAKSRRDYANYMQRHHPYWYRWLNRRLDRSARRIKQTNRRVRRTQRTPRRHVKVLKARFTRSNNRRALRRSGFLDTRQLGGSFIFNRYAPNDRRAVIPKRLRVNHWAEGVLFQKHPQLYSYFPSLHGWVRVK